MSSMDDGKIPSAARYQIGRRYLHGKTNLPLTLRYIGPLPPRHSASGSPPPPEDPTRKTGSGSSSSGSIWLGVEYDDPTHGKHSGVFEGRQVFQVQQEGAGAFIKFKSGLELVEGPTLAQAIEERYGRISTETGGATDPIEQGGSSQTQGQGQGQGQDGAVVLGSSNHAIIVEAPGIAEVQKRISKLERLRELGLEGQWISRLGGDAGVSAVLRRRLAGLEPVTEPAFQLGGCIEDRGCFIWIDDFGDEVDWSDGHESQDLSALDRVEELHIGRSSIKAPNMASLFPNLQVLHLNDNTLLSAVPADPTPPSSWSKLEMVSIEGCGYQDWSDILATNGNLPMLQTLNVSSLPLDTISPYPYRSTQSEKAVDCFPSLTSLICLDTRLRDFADIDHLNEWTSGRIQSLRFSIAMSDDPMAQELALRLDQNSESQCRQAWMTNTNDKERQILIAKLPNLRLLNLSPVGDRERNEAEVAYIAFVDKTVESRDAGPDDRQSEQDVSRIKSSWGRYDQLVKKHGVRQAEKPRAAVLKSKLINLHVYPALGGTSTPFSPFSLALLPSFSIGMLRKKIARKVAVKPDACMLWTSRQVSDEEQESVAQPGVMIGAGDTGAPREKVAKIDEGEVGWWFVDGDCILVEIDT